MQPQAVRAHTSAIASSGSIAPVFVVPAVATTATASFPAAWSASTRRSSSSGRIRWSGSEGTTRMQAEPRPSTSAALVTQLWLSVPV